MIPCLICGQDAGTGWIVGFPPAPDSQKMALCKKHDLPEHREKTQQAWLRFMYDRLEELTRNEQYRHGGGERLLSIYFNGGGSLSLPCASYAVTEDQAIKILTPSQETIFFPLSQVRNYALSPLDTAGASQALEA